jgi:lysophospholipase L1-like esterase
MQLNIQFFDGTFSLTPGSFSEIDKLSEYLITNKDVNAYIRGHVCCGKALKLSKQRAKLVLKELVKHKPKKIIFYDGVNDVGKCMKNLNYFSTGQEIVLQSLFQSMSSESYSKKLIIAPLKILEKVKKFFQKNQNTELTYNCDTDVSKAEEIAKTFVNNWISVELIAKKNNIKFIPILQPTIFTSTSNKDYLSTNYDELKKQYEILYELIKKELKKEDFKYLNLENSLNKAENYFIDFCHLSPNGNMKIASEIVKSDFF